MIMRICSACGERTAALEPRGNYGLLNCSSCGHIEDVLECGYDDEDHGDAYNDDDEAEDEDDEELTDEWCDDDD
jgi:hypothetical protein